MNEGEADDAMRLVHSIKGVAANLGAEGLSAVAEAVELQITSKTEIDEENWDKLVRCHGIAMEGLDQ